MITPRVDLYHRISANRTNSALLIALFVILLTVLGLAGGYAVGAPLLDHRGVVNSLFDTHPPTVERIKRLRSM